MLFPASRISLLLETIVQVWITAAEQLHETGPEIEWEEKQAPALVLSDVNMFMGTNAPENRVIDANYHVTEGNRDKPMRSRKKRNDPIKLSAGDFNNAIDAADGRAQAHCKG
jgi:hypothetical protein